MKRVLAVGHVRHEYDPYIVQDIVNTRVYADVGEELPRYSRVRATLDSVRDHPNTLSQCLTAIQVYADERTTP